MDPAYVLTCILAYFGILFDILFGMWFGKHLGIGASIILWTPCCSEYQPFCLADQPGILLEPEGLHG